VRRRSFNASVPHARRLEFALNPDIEFKMFRKNIGNILRGSAHNVPTYIL